MSDAYQIRPYQHGDEEDIVPLLELAFGEWPRLDIGCSPTEHWRWKYSDNPNGVMNIVAESKGRIVGCDHAINRRIKIGDEVFLCSITTDVAVHPDFRNTGVWKGMIDFRAELKVRAGIKMNYFLSGNPVVVRRMSKIHPQFPHRIVNLVRIRDIDEHLKHIPMDRSRLIGLGFKAAVTMSRARHALSGPKTKEHVFDISEPQRFDSRIDEFWSRINNGYSFIAERSLPCLNWMYFDPRGGPYSIRQAEESEQILGYTAMGVNGYLRDYPIGFVTDLLTLPGRLDVAEALADAACEYFDEKGVNIVNYLVVKGNPYSKVFERRGFLDSRFKLHMFYNTKELSERMRGLRNRTPESVMFSWGDHDTLPVEAPRS